MWRDLLYENGVRHMSLSFMGLRRRVKRLDRWRLADKFPADVKIYLDSGAFTLNRDSSTITAAEAAELREAYFQFVSDNIHDLEFAAEFDATVLGHDAVFASRESFWGTLPTRKWMPVWHADYGTSNLIALGDEYGRVGVLQDDAAGDLSLALNRMAEGGALLHGVAMTQMDLMREIRWSSVGSTRWLAPSQYGDTFIWTGRELKDYPKKYKEQGRKRHRSWLDSNDFDTALIEADDSRELLRLSIWSWRKYVDHLNGVTGLPETPPAGFPELPPDSVGGPGTSMRNEEPPSGEIAARVPGGRTLLPVVGFDFETVKRIGETGQQEEIREPRMTTPSTPLLQCDTCFMKAKCPKMTPGADCAYEIPVTIRTPGQLDAAASALIEMQLQRVLLMRMIEQREGGYSDPNLSTEIARAWRMLKDRMSGSDTIKLTLEASGQVASAGLVSRLWGDEAGQRLAALEAPRLAQSVVDDIVDAQLVDET